MIKYIYNANRNTFIFESRSKITLNPRYNEDTDPIGEAFIYNPRTASLVKPPGCAEFESAVLINGDWVIKINKIGQHYYTKKGKKINIDDIGVDVPIDCIQNDPPTIYHDSHDGTKWIENVKEKNIAEIEQLRIEEHKAESLDLIGKNLSEKETWIKKCLNETTLDNQTKNSLSKVFKKLLSFGY